MAGVVCVGFAEDVELVLDLAEVAAAWLELEELDVEDF